MPALLNFCSTDIGSTCDRTSQSRARKLFFNTLEAKKKSSMRRANTDVQTLWAHRLRKSSMFAKRSSSDNTPDKLIPEAHNNNCCTSLNNIFQFFSLELSGLCSTLISEYTLIDENEKNKTLVTYFQLLEHLGSRRELWKVKIARHSVHEIMSGL